MLCHSSVGVILPFSEAYKNNVLYAMKYSVAGWVLQEPEADMELPVQKVHVKGKERKPDWAGGAIRLQ